MKINDRVKAKYFGHDITGTIVAYDSSSVGIKLDVPIHVYGSMRDGVALVGPREIGTITLLESRDHVAVFQFCDHVMMMHEEDK